MPRRHAAPLRDGTREKAPLIDQQGGGQRHRHRGEREPRGRLWAAGERHGAEAAGGAGERRGLLSVSIAGLGSLSPLPDLRQGRNRMRPFGSAKGVSLVSGFEVRNIQVFVVEAPVLRLSSLGRLWPVLHMKPFQEKTSTPAETKKGRAL